jgi:hypothetical protein
VKRTPFARELHAAMSENGVRVDDLLHLLGFRGSWLLAPDFDAQTGGLSSGPWSVEREDHRAKILALVRGAPWSPGYWRHRYEQGNVTARILNAGISSSQSWTKFYRSEACCWERMPFLSRLLWAFFPRRFPPGRHLRPGMTWDDVWPR